MRLLGVHAVVLLGLWFPAHARAAGAADAILAQSSAALASGQYQEARVLATAGLSEVTVEALLRSRLLVVRGLAQQAQGAADEALVDFTTALQSSGLQGEEQARALFARGLTLDGQGRLEAAIGDYSAALQASPRAPYALNNRANVFRRLGRFPEARRDYTAALSGGAANPQYPYYGLAQIAEAEGDPQTARGLYSQALAVDPNFALARERLQALGAPAESLAADAGPIMLRPPPEAVKAPDPLAAAPVVPALQPPSQQRTVARQPQTMAQARSPRSTPALVPGRGAPLRPAIVEAVEADSNLVQLGAWRSDAEARHGWSVAQARADGLLDGLSPVIVQEEVPGRGTFYRLRVGARGGAGSFCASLGKQGLACLQVRD